MTHRLTHYLSDFLVGQILIRKVVPVMHPYKDHRCRLYDEIILLTDVLFELRISSKDLRLLGINSKGELWQITVDSNDVQALIRLSLINDLSVRSEIQLVYDDRFGFSWTEDIQVKRDAECVND